MHEGGVCMRMPDYRYVLMYIQMCVDYEGT